MQELIKEIKEYKERNGLTDEKCAEILEISVEKLNDIKENKVNLEKSEVDKIFNIIQKKSKSKSSRVIKILDLIFRFIATIMPIVVLLLCINNYDNMKHLIVLLSIGVACTSMTILPKIEKK